MSLLNNIRHSNASVNHSLPIITIDAEELTHSDSSLMPGFIGTANCSSQNNESVRSSSSRRCGPNDQSWQRQPSPCLSFTQIRREASSSSLSPSSPSLHSQTSRHTASYGEEGPFYSRDPINTRRDPSATRSLIELFSWPTRSSIDDIEASTPLTSEYDQQEVCLGGSQNRDRGVSYSVTPRLMQNGIPSRKCSDLTSNRYHNELYPSDDDVSTCSNQSPISHHDNLHDHKIQNGCSHPQQFRMISAHGRELDPRSSRISTAQPSGNLGLDDSPVATEPNRPGDTAAPEEKKEEESRVSENGKPVRRKKSSRLKSLRSKDLRFRRPRIRPRLNKWDPQNPDSPKLVHPWPNPKWLEKIQRKLPWYETAIEAGGGPWLNLRAWDAPYKYLLLQEFKMRWQNRGDRWLLMLRLAGVSILVLVLLLINVATLGDFYGNIEGVEQIWDWFHQITTPINDYVWRNQAAFSGLMFTASFLIDLLFLWVFFQWVVIGDSMRLPLAYGMLYGLRGVQRAYCLLPFPDGYIWAAPKFGSVHWPSLVVPYQPADDFFYSGHIGCGTLAVVEHFYVRNWWGVGFSIFVTVFEAFWMCCTRGHYMIDMFAGAIVASWSHMIAQIITKPVDQWLALPPRPYIRLAAKSLSAATQRVETHDAVVVPQREESFRSPSAQSSAHAMTASPSSEYQPSPLSLEEQNPDEQFPEKRADYVLAEVKPYIECVSEHGTESSSFHHLSLTSSPDWEYFHTLPSLSKNDRRLSLRSEKPLRSSVHYQSIPSGQFSENGVFSRDERRRKWSSGNVGETRA